MEDNLNQHRSLARPIYINSNELYRSDPCKCGPEGLSLFCLVFVLSLRRPCSSLVFIVLTWALLLSHQLLSIKFPAGLVPTTTPWKVSAQECGTRGILTGRPATPTENHREGFLRGVSRKMEPALRLCGSRANSPSCSHGALTQGRFSITKKRRC